MRLPLERPFYDDVHEIVSLKGRFIKGAAAVGIANPIDNHGLAAPRQGLHDRPDWDGR